MSLPKIILVWLIVTKKWCAHQYRLFRSLFALSTLFDPKAQNFWKIKEAPGDIIILHQCTKNHNHMIFNSQNMMWIALQVILGHLCLLPNFWPKKSKFSEKRKKHVDISSFYTSIPKSNLDKFLSSYLNIIYQRSIKYLMNFPHLYLKWGSKVSDFGYVYSINC